MVTKKTTNEKIEEIMKDIALMEVHLLHIRKHNKQKVNRLEKQNKILKNIYDFLKEKNEQQ